MKFFKLVMFMNFRLELYQQKLNLNEFRKRFKLALELKRSIESLPFSLTGWVNYSELIKTDCLHYFDFFC